MTDKSEKVSKLVLACAAGAIGLFLIAKYQKNIRRKTKEILYSFDLAKRKFEVEIINHPNECKRIIDKITE
jgi:cellobiose-specific phosphotransferase system component IIB